MRWLTFRRQAGEEGVTLILLCALAVTVILMGAFVVDVGALLQERRELQNGADAAATALAHSCALSSSTGDCASDTNAAAAAAPYVNGNALDGKSNVDAAHVDKTARTVSVVASTRTASGGASVPFSLARVIGQTGKTVHASAVAKWGPPAGGTPVPMALSFCEFNAAAFGTTTVVIFHTSSKKSNHCSGPAGADTPGGFGWLDATSGCTAAIDAGSNVSADVGASVPKECDLNSLLGTTILIPIFDKITPSGTQAIYHIAGFGAFVFNGYRFPSSFGGSPVPCKSPDTCVSGTFTHFVSVADIGSFGGSDFGVSVIRLVS